jgi:3-deoxy-D-manno-octulosonate 8-phosphate phosphatase (KDO 8-P phosphatase)
MQEGPGKDVESRIKRVRLLVLDVDGVLTDGRITYTNDGVEIKAFDVKDGHGVKLLMRSGVDVAIVTARSSKVVGVRAADLGIKTVYQGALDKSVAFEDILKKTGLSPEELAYVGDDLVDLPVLRRVGFAATVSDAVQEVRDAVHYVASRPGGRGAVREIAELVMKVQKSWDSVTERYYS